MTAPAITPATFPYRRKWTQEQIDEVLVRKDRLVAAMTDPVGPTGQAMNLPPDILHILALHVALAGGDVNDGRAYIAARRTTGGLFADSVQWLLKTEYEPAAPDPDEVAAKARAAADQIRRQLPPDVRAAVLAMMNEESGAQ